MTSRTMTTCSEDETLRAGRELAGILKAGDIVLLEGALGMGKTCFTRGVAIGLGVSPEEVRSPSYTLINPYRGRLPVHHVDLYRIEKSSDIDELGLEEILESDGVAIVEWAERLGPWRPLRCVAVRIDDLGGNERRITIEDRRA
jgi:tRNA threonylcarbamoyladenosine biosynthesis protein TsaE